MDWDDLKFFLAVARASSIRGAAKQLGVNHATVSRRINSLEEKLSARLFERLPSGYVLTEPGEDMYQESHHLEERINTLQRRIIGKDSTLSGTIRVTIPDVLSYNFLMQDMATFSELYPDVELQISSSYEMLDLNKREADVAIRMTNEPPEHLIGRKIATVFRSNYVSQDYFKKHSFNPPHSSANWIGLGYSKVIVNWMKSSAYPNSPIKHEIDNTLQQLDACKGGMGMAILPCLLADADPMLRRIPPYDVEPALDIWILTHPDLRNTTRINTFVKYMSESILAKQALIEGRCPREF